MNTETETLGARIRTLRRARHLTQQQLADGIGVVKQTISSWEKDNAKNMTLRNLFALADALDSDPRYLALGTNDRICTPLYGFPTSDTGRFRIRHNRGSANK